jgi:hypothetical protein
MNRHHQEISMEIVVLKRQRELLDKQIKELEEDYEFAVEAQYDDALA